METVKQMLAEFWMPLAVLCFAAIIIAVVRLTSKPVQCPQCESSNTRTVDEWGGVEGRRCNDCNFGWSRTL